MKKGYLLTLGMFMVLILVFALAISFNKSVEISKDRLGIIGISDRVFDLSSSVGNGLIDIIKIYSDFDIVIEENTKVNVSFTEEISRVKEDWGISLDERIAEFEDFISSQDKNIKFTTKSFDKELPLEITPYNITYSRAWGTGQVILKVVPQTINFDGFEILINTSQEMISQVNVPSSNPGSFKFIVKAVDNFGTNIVKENNIDPEKNNQVHVNLVGGNQVKVTVSNNELEVWTNSPETIIATIKIFGLPVLNKQVAVVYPKIVYNVTFPELNIVKLADIQFM
nr:hypothetical protein [Candidatus Woesearchaeota archaeon]